MLIDHRSIPASECIHDMHDVFAFRCETRDRFALDDRFACLWIQDSGKDCWTMAQRTHDAAVGVDRRSDALETFGRGIVDQSSMAGRGEEDAVL